MLYRVTFDSSTREEGLSIKTLFKAGSWSPGWVRITIAEGGCPPDTVLRASVLTPASIYMRCWPCRRVLSRLAFLTGFEHWGCGSVMVLTGL